VTGETHLHVWVILYKEEGRKRGRRDFFPKRISWENGQKGKKFLDRQFCRHRLETEDEFSGFRRLKLYPERAELSG